MYLYLATRSLTHGNRQGKAGGETGTAERFSPSLSATGPRPPRTYRSAFRETSRLLVHERRCSGWSRWSTEL